MAINWRKNPDRAVTGWAGTRIECHKIFEQLTKNFENKIHIVVVGTALYIETLS